MTETSAVKNNRFSSDDGTGSAGHTTGHRISHNSNQTAETRATDRRASRIAVLQTELPPEFFEAIGKDAQKKKTPKYVTVSRSIVENNYVVAFTTILTIYALIGDDLRLICTNRPADQYFNICVFICIFVFTLECVLSCVGKDDYYLSFFFWLEKITKPHSSSFSFITIGSHQLVTIALRISHVRRNTMAMRFGLACLDRTYPK
jgi:hypothetical protein